MTEQTNDQSVNNFSPLNKPSAFILDAMTIDERMCFDGLLNDLGTYLRNEKNYTVHSVSQTSALDVIFCVQDNIARPAKHILPNAVRYWWKDYNLSEAYHEVYKSILMANSPMVMNWLDTTLEEVWQPQQGVFTAENFNRVQPMSGAIGCFRVNNWKPYIHRNQPDDELKAQAANWMYDFTERLWQDEDERKIIVQWLAHMFKRPDERPSWHIMMPSDTGTGKGVLFTKILYPLLAGQAQQVKSYAQITGKFSTVLDGNLLVMIDDAQATAKQELQMKSILTEDSLLIEKKYQAERYTKVFARFLLASNETVPMALEENDRRWFCCSFMEHKESREETQAFISGLIEFLEQDGALEAVWQWFNSIDLSDFSAKKCPAATEAKKKLYVPDVDSVGELVNDFVRDKNLFAIRELLEATGLRKNDQEISKALGAAGFTQHKIQTARSKKLEVEHNVKVGKPTFYYREMSQQEAENLYVETYLTAEGIF